MLLTLILAATIGQTGGHIGEQEFWQGYNGAGGKAGGGDAYIDGLIRNGQLPPLPGCDTRWHMKTNADGSRSLWRGIAPGAGETDPNSLPVDFYPKEACPATAGGTYVVDPPDPPTPSVPTPTPTPATSIRTRIPVPVAFAMPPKPAISPVPIQSYANAVAFPAGGSSIIVQPAVRLDCKEVIARELATYPPGFLASNGLRRVVIGNEMSFNGKTEGGFTDVPSGTIFLVAGDDLGYLRRGVHHEVYHILDPRIGDAGWQAMNSPGFYYGSAADAPGFLSGYAKKNPGEDRAETFADYMTNPSLVVRQSKSDPITKAKVDWMKARLARSLPAFSERGY